MNCRYFEHLILSRSVLSGDALPERQEVALREHLLVCPSCKKLANSWHKVDVLFQQSALYSQNEVVPTPGFSDRWLARLEQEKRDNERRQLWTSISFFLGSAGMVLSIMIVWMVLTWGSPITWFTDALAFTIALPEYLSMLRNIAGIIGEVMTSWELLSVQVVSFTTLAFLSVVWLYALNKTSIIKRLT